MNELKKSVISYLNMGLNPTVISFQDDGLYYLFDKLLQGVTTSNSYDPAYSFVHVTLNYLDDLTSKNIENEIHEQLQNDNFEGDTIIETYLNDIVTVCVLDDIAFIDNVEKAIKAVDSLITKYRGALLFVYVVEDPMLVNTLKNKVDSSTHFFDAIMYQKIGKHWSTKDLDDLFSKQFYNKISPKILNSISLKTNNHLGTFKRLYKDNVLNFESTEKYIRLMLDSFDNSLLNTFKKLSKSFELTAEEQEIIQAYSNVGFIKDNQITIPLFREVIDKIIIQNKITLNESSGSLQGIDLNYFNTTEREIIENLYKAENELTKAQIGDIIWKDKVNERYSEWAIDQRIARLRKKIIDLGFNIDIRANYKKGYQLTFINK